MKHVIVGSGVAGMTAALQLSRYDDTEIHVYTEDTHSYYYRPEVTNFLAGVKSKDEVVRRPASWYEKRGIHVHLGQTVVSVRPDEKEIILGDETHVGYDTLLLAPGSHPFVPPIKGAETTGVFTIRTLEDAQQIKTYIHDAECQHAVVIGGGLLGLEGARGLKGMGLEVTIVELMPRLMPLQLDAQGGEILRDFVEAQGYDVIVDNSASEIKGEAHVTGVELRDGTSLHADMVVIATGVRPNTRLAEEAGLTLNRGIEVDDRLRTSAPDIYAAGDAAHCMGRTWAIVPPAQAQARVAAQNMAGEEAHYEEVTPYTSLKVVGIDVDSMGKTTVDDEDKDEIDVVRYADPDAHKYIKVLLRDEVIIGSIVINNADLAKELRDLTQKDATVSREDVAALIEAA
jgi:nitrite reductase (NADH) large subunit